MKRRQYTFVKFAQTARELFECDQGKKAWRDLITQCLIMYLKGRK